MRKRSPLLFIMIPIAVVSIILFLGTTRERTQLMMGTFVRMRVNAPFWYNFDTAFKNAFAAAAEVDLMADLYEKDSQLSRLNSSDHLEPYIVSDDFFVLLKESLRLCHESDGTLDITISPLVKIWRRCRAENSLPEEEDIKRSLTLVNYKNLLLDRARKSVYFKERDMSIDLSAVAKGYAVDKAIKELKRLGVSSAIVNAGGDMYCLGKKSIFRQWSIGIASPGDNTAVEKTLYLSDRAVATSGGYEQYFTHKGKRYSHLIDPRTGYPVKGGFSYVTVTAPNCMLADAVATAVSIGGEAVKEKFEELYPGIQIIMEY